MRIFRGGNHQKKKAHVFGTVCGEYSYWKAMNCTAFDPKAGIEYASWHPAARLANERMCLRYAVLSSALRTHATRRPPQNLDFLHLAV